MYQGGDSFSSLGCNKDERYNGESTYITIIISIGIITITVNIITLGSSGEWKPGSYVAVVTFVTLALALVIGTAYDIFIRVVYELFSDVGEIRVWFASKILTPCRMH